VIEPDRDHFLYAARRLAAKDRNGLADSEDMATELRIGLYQVIELVVQIKRLNPAWKPPLDPLPTFASKGWAASVGLSPPRIVIGKKSSHAAISTPKTMEPACQFMKISQLGAFCTRWA
jgi:hypothetical protein